MGSAMSEFDPSTFVMTAMGCLLGIFITRLVDECTRLRLVASQLPSDHPTPPATSMPSPTPLTQEEVRGVADIIFAKMSDGIIPACCTTCGHNEMSVAGTVALRDIHTNGDPTGLEYRCAIVVCKRCKHISTFLNAASPGVPSPVATIGPRPDASKPPLRVVDGSAEQSHEENG